MRTLVVGGTGTVGSEVVRRLVSLGEPVRVASRTAGAGESPTGEPQQAQVDLEQPATLGPALAGCERMVLITPLAPNEAEQGCAAVLAAAEAGVRHVVFMSVQDADQAPHVPHFASKVRIRQALEEAGLPHTVILPNNFFQNDLWFRDAMLQFGVYPQPIGSYGTSRVDVRDIADAIVSCVRDRQHAGRSYTIAGPQALTGEEVAATWTRHLGREIRYAGDDLDAWRVQAQQMLPGWLVDDLLVMYRWFQVRGLVATEQQLSEQETLIGRKPRAFDDFAAEVSAAWRSEAQ